jgi:hypothetical protein
MVVPQNTPVARSAVWKEDTLPPAGKQHDHLGSKRAGQSEKDQQSASPMRSAEIVVVEPARAFLPSARLANMAPSVSLPSGLSKPQETTRPLTAAKLSRPKPPERASEMKRSPAVNFFRKPASHEAPPRVKKQTGQASPERSEAQATVEPRTQQQSGFATAAQTTQLPKAKAGNVVIQNLEVRVIAPKQPVPPPQKAPQQQRPESGAWSSSARYYLRKV